MFLWLVMAVSVALYFVVVNVVELPPREPNTQLVTTLLVVAFGLVAASFPVKSRLLAQAREGNAPGREQVAHVLALVLCEAAALLGVVVRFVTGSAHYYIFLVAGLAAILLHYPRREG